MSRLGGFVRDLTVALLVVLLLCVDGWGCGSPSSPEPEHGWCCDGFCGLDGYEAFPMIECTCDGYVTPHTADNRGECIARTEGT